MKFAIASVAGLAIATTASASHILDIGGNLYQAGTPQVLGSIVNNTGGVTSIEFDLAINAGNFGENLSWGSEFQLQIDGPSGFVATAGGGDIFADLTFGWANTGGTFTFTGKLDVVSAGPGTYTLSVFDTFDDAGNDGFILAGSTVTFIPTPGSAAILGLGGIAMMRRRR